MMLLVKKEILYIVYFYITETLQRPLLYTHYILYKIRFHLAAHEMCFLFTIRPADHAV